MIVALPGLFSYLFCLCFFSRFSIAVAITSLGLSVFRAFVCFACVGLCVRDWLCLVIVALHGLFFLPFLRRKRILSVNSR